MNTRIAKVGFEIEGEFTPELTSIMSGKGEMKGDGSLRSCSHGEHNRKRLYCGEFNSVPYARRSTHSQRKIFDLLQAEYEQGNFHFNNTCGFHIHTSFRPKRPPELISSLFCHYFYVALKKEFPEVIKKREHNSFCEFAYNDTIIAHPTDRHIAINYLSLPKHGTVEFRIFPTDEPKSMYEYLKFTIHTIEDFEKTSPKMCFDEEVDMVGERIERFEGVAMNLKGDKLCLETIPIDIRSAKIKL